jgi:hypothetical protein
MLSRTESACLGDASIGVARNPLRDGAPPTGLSTASEHDVRPAESTKSFAVLHRAPGQRRSTWVTACASSFRRAPPGNDGHGLRHSSRPCSPHIKDDWLESNSFSSRSCTMQRASWLALATAGLVSPLCEPGRFPSDQGEKTLAHMVPRAARAVRLRSLRRFNVTSKIESRRKSQYALRGRDPIEKA